MSLIRMLGTKHIACEFLRFFSLIVPNGVEFLQLKIPRGISSGSVESLDKIIIQCLRDYDITVDKYYDYINIYFKDLKNDKKYIFTLPKFRLNPHKSIMFYSPFFKRLGELAAKNIRMCIE